MAVDNAPKLKNDDITHKIIAIIAENKSLDVNTITSTTALTDFGFDSFDTTEFIFLSSIK